MGMFSIGVIGAGRVGSVLAARLREAGHEIAAVAGESDASRTRIETLLPGVPVAEPTTVARSCDLLLLTVPDDALADLVHRLVASGAVRPGHVVVHTSGMHGVAVLRPAVDVGARGVAMHPAMTFTGTATDVERLAGCAFGVTARQAERDVVQRLVADLRGRVVWVDEDDRTLYHAALAHGANHLVTLVAQAMDVLRAAGSADPAATLRPLLEAALNNALAYGDDALTGPVLRGDLQTVRAHVDSLAAAAPDTVRTYVGLARATVERAAADGRLDIHRAAALTETLDGAQTVSSA